MAEDEGAGQEDTGSSGGGDPAPARQYSAPSVGTNANARKIFGFMGFAVVFSVIGAEVRTIDSGAASASSILDKPPVIFLGGAIAAALLVLLADTGEAGEQLGTGLALITLITSTLVNGAPVWNAITKLTSGSTKVGSGGSVPSGQGTSGAISPGLPQTTLTPIKVGQIGDGK
jgi:hypothetical protein